MHAQMRRLGSVAGPGGQLCKLPAFAIDREYDNSSCSVPVRRPSLAHSVQIRTDRGTRQEYRIGNAVQILDVAKSAGVGVHAERGDSIATPGAGEGPDV